MTRQARLDVLPRCVRNLRLAPCRTSSPAELRAGGFSTTRPRGRPARIGPLSATQAALARELSMRLGLSLAHTASHLKYGT